MPSTTSPLTASPLHGGDTTNPDAELLRLGEELDADTASGDRHPTIVAAILRHKAHTLAGAQVKARASAWCTAEGVSGSELPGCTADQQLAGSIADDLLAMEAGVPGWALDDTLLLGTQRLPSGNSFHPLLGLKILNARIALSRRGEVKRISPECCILDIWRPVVADMRCERHCVIYFDAA